MDDEYHLLMEQMRDYELLEEEFPDCQLTFK